MVPSEFAITRVHTTKDFFFYQVTRQLLPICINPSWQNSAITECSDFMKVSFGTKKTFIFLNFFIEVALFPLKLAICAFLLNKFSNTQKHCSKHNCSLKTSVHIISQVFSQTLIRLVFKRTDAIALLQYLA